MLTHSEYLERRRPAAGGARGDFRRPASPKKAGLDPTTFNKSKRITPEGRNRWPVHGVDR